MSSVASHYETHLAPIYVWMAGGMEQALKLGASDVAEFLDTRGYAVDLGAGFVCRIEAGPRGMVKSALMPNPSPKLTCSGMRRKHPQAA
jgi:hypothetical protein